MHNDTNTFESATSGWHDPVRIVAWSAAAIAVMLIVTSIAWSQLSNHIADSRDQRVHQSQTLVRMSQAQTEMERTREQAKASLLFAPATRPQWVVKIDRFDRQFDQQLSELQSGLKSAGGREAATKIGVAHDTLHMLSVSGLDSTQTLGKSLRDRPQARMTLTDVLNLAGGGAKFAQDILADKTAGAAYINAYDDLRDELSATARVSQRAEKRFETIVQIFEWTRNILILVILGFAMAHLRRWRERAGAAYSELEDANERNQAVLGSTDEAIFGLNENGRIVFVNARAESMFLDTRLDGKALHLLLHKIAHTACTDEAVCAFREVCSGNVFEQRHQARVVNNWDAEIDLEMAAFRVAGDRRDLKRVVVLHDITERLQVERMKDEFLSIVSHELRTPLTAMRASIGIVATGALGPLTEPLERAIDISARNMDRLTRLIEDLLIFERDENVELESQPGSAAEILETADLSHRDLAGQRGIALVTEVPDPDITVLCDHDALEQIMTNLVGNAIKFSPDDSEIALSVSEQDGMAQFNVRDNGSGIPAKEHERIFERFAQVNSTDTRGVGGTGLGLAICQQLVDRHGGTIWVKSDVGEGSTFSFTLPLATSTSSLNLIASADVAAH